MREGCLIGCLGLIAVTMILTIVAVVALDGFFGLFREADRVSLVEFYGHEHDVMVLVEPDFDLIGSSVAEATNGSPWLVDYVLPYEVTLFADVDREANTFAYTLAASMKRMAGFLSYYLPRGEGLTLFGEAEITDLGVNSSGVAFATATAPISAETLERAVPLQTLADPDPFRIEGGHLGQIVINNASGNAFIALEELFRGNSSRPESERLITPDEEELLARNITTARLTFDTVTTDTVALDVRARLVEPASAATIIPLLDELVRQLAFSDDHTTVEVEGEFREEGNELIGTYELKHVRHTIGKNWREALDTLDQQMQEHFQKIPTSN